VTSDIYTKAKQKQYTRLMAKYLGPAIAAGVMNRALVDNEGQMDPRTKALVGSGGLSAWVPMTSFLSAGDAFGPVNVTSPLSVGKAGYDWMSKELSGNANARDRRRGRRALKKATQQYVPVFGGMWKAYETNVENILLNENSGR